MHSILNKGDERLSKTSDDSLDVYIAKLAVAGAAVTVLGDSLALLAASLTLQQLQQSSTEQPAVPKEIEEQINQLISELKAIKRMMRDTKV